MNRSVRTVLRSAISLGRAGASLLTAMLVASSCSEQGITKPPTGATQAATPGVAVGHDTAPVVGRGPKINTGATVNGANNAGSITAAGQTDNWTFSASQGQIIWSRWAR